MHPADEFDAFAGLVAAGKPIEDIAAAFGTTPAAVQRRLKLAYVNPELMNLYRADEITLQALMAFTVNDDHEMQLAVWRGLSQWDRTNPHVIRNRLTKGDMVASHPLAQFVTLPVA